MTSMASTSLTCIAWYLHRAASRDEPMAAAGVALLVSESAGRGSGSAVDGTCAQLRENCVQGRSEGSVEVVRPCLCGMPA